jgi:ABC-type histidine transport system ATPase subunit
MSQRPRRISLAKTLNREPCLISIKTFDDPASVIPPDAFAAVLNVVTARLNQRVIR